MTWDWNPNVQDIDPLTYDFPGQAVDPSPFYPTNAYVDWIGVDGYSKQVSPMVQGSPPKTFDQIFSGWYSEFNTNAYGKPMMIGETGSCQYYDNNPDYTPDQIGYLASIQTSLESPQYAMIKAVDYFDAPGSYDVNGSAQDPCTWSLSAQILPEDSISGLTELRSIANDPFFLNFVSNQ
jgi:beta-mannanase